MPANAITASIQNGY